MSTYEELTPQLEVAAVARYEQKATENPHIHEFASLASTEDTPAFRELLQSDFFAYKEQIEMGIYRILMDFTTVPEDETALNSVHSATIIGTLIFLADIYGRDWQKACREFALLTVSMKIVEDTYDVPNLLNQEARFGFLFSLALDAQTATGLQRPELVHRNLAE